MKFFGVIGTLVAACLLPATQATWCQLFYDGGCSNSANGKINFDCANPNIFGSGGGFIKCHSTKGNKQTCLVSRCNDAACSTSDNFDVAADQDCVNMKGAGPYYKLGLL
ncbi:hypothetical protein F4804DRAFT_347286 [Jackrogersella minutella]|nr:hypothetical protein F4804DRAFT_347286 [Jackrogersella minutella]